MLNSSAFILKYINPITQINGVFTSCRSGVLSHLRCGIRICTRMWYGSHTMAASSATYVTREQSSQQQTTRTGWPVLQHIDFSNIMAKLQAWRAGWAAAVPVEAVIGIRGKAISPLTSHAEACPVIIAPPSILHAGLINQSCIVPHDEHVNMCWSP